jgi:hypothetical protein
MSDPHSACRQVGARYVNLMTRTGTATAHTVNTIGADYSTRSPGRPAHRPPGPGSQVTAASDWQNAV